MDGQEMKDKIRRSGLTLKEIAERCKCTPQHLSAVQNGRARLSDKLANKIQAVLQDEAFSAPVYVTVRFKEEEWDILQNELPEDIDLEATIREFVWWLSGKYFIAKMPKDQRDAYMIRNTLDGHPTNESLPLVFFKRPAGTPIQERTAEIPFTRPSPE